MLFDFSDAALGLLSNVDLLRPTTVTRQIPFRPHDRIGLYEEIWKALAGCKETTEQRFAVLRQSELSGIDVELECCQGIPAIEIGC